MRCAIVIAAAGLLVTGCSQSPYLEANLELMNAERRALEDRLYELEYEYEARVVELEQYRQDNTSLRQQLGLSDKEENAASRDLEDDSPSLEDYDPPVIEQGEMMIPRVEIPRDEGADIDSEKTDDIAGPVLGTARLDAHVTHIDVNSRFLTGVDFDEAPGDDGLAIVVEPRNKAGELVRLPGPISVVVLDYAKRGRGEAARVAQWDLTSTDVSRFLEDSPLDEGIGLHLLWPDEPPDHGRLRVDVRYFTVDGRHLDARSDVRVALPPRLSQRWTPRSGQGGGQRLASAPAKEKPRQPAGPATGPEKNDSDPVRRPEWSPYR